MRPFAGLLTSAFLAAGLLAATAQSFRVAPDPAAPPINITQQAQLLFAQGQNYELGRNVPQDYGKAMETYRQAVAAGHPLAEFRIGYLYERGLGVTRDLDLARVWYIKAAKDGIPNANTRLALLPGPKPQ